MKLTVGKNYSWLGDYSCALRADRVGRIAETTGAQENLCDEQPRCAGKNGPDVA